MIDKEPSPRKNYFRFAWVLIGVVAVGIFLAAGGMVYAANQEEHDPFCASCHTEPETTFVQRSTDTQAVDLASFHTGEKTRCIDCHSGPGIVGRVQAELLGARNAVAWYTHTSVQPAHLKFPIQDATCLTCHQEVTQQGYRPEQSLGIVDGGDEEGGPNHWHEWLGRWQAVAPDAGTCVSCHSGHLTDGSAQTGFENLQTTDIVCEGCHQQLGEGEGGG